VHCDRAVAWERDKANLKVIYKLFTYFVPDIHFSWKKVVEMNKAKSEVFTENLKIIRSEGEVMGSGQKLWKRAKSVIPGGNMLLSKRPEMFLPDHWPSYFSKSKGCEVWDLDNNRYIDMSIMGIGTNILGYGNEEVDEAVRSVIGNGNMSTLNCPEEVYLAEKLIELHPWADMAKFARSGGEANAIAIRIARAACGKDKVAICGYHGWHDWYLSANLGDDENLAGHLLPGLNPAGVPKELKGSVFTFNYNDYEGLNALVEHQDIGIIKMEVVRNKGPENGFLQKVRKLATDKGIILIFDECTSGFRQNLGGIHKIHDIQPDMAMFGKALGNGYAITAVIGRKSIMEAAQGTFISSTFWTERIGSAAALKTLEVMECTKSWDYITLKGGEIRNKWQNLADKYDIEIVHWGIPALTGFSFLSEKALIYKTYITQEMLKLRFLASNSIYVSVAHTDELIDQYFSILDPLFADIANYERGDKGALKLDGPICHSGFKRLN
jgi:glutamate-1-semialdehyde 2,1-aminomutase